MIKGMNVKIPISIAIITKNEEERLPDCLKSLSFAEDGIEYDPVIFDLSDSDVKEIAQFDIESGNYY